MIAGLAFLLLGSGGTQLGGPVAQAATLSYKHARLPRAHVDADDLIRA